MAAATNAQVQVFVDQYIRQHCQQARALVLTFDNDRASIDSVYQAVNAQSPTWTDNRTDGPPNLLTPADVLAYNAFAEDVRAYMKAHNSYTIILKACVNPVL